MSPLTLVWANLKRKKLRTVFTLGSVAVAFLLFAFLGALGRAFSVGLEIAGADRLITMHKVSFIEPLPLAYVNRVRNLEGVAEVSHQSWFGAYYQDPKQQFGLFPVEFDAQSEVYPEYKVSPEQWESLLNTQAGLMLGRAMANQLQVEVGDRIPLSSTIWSQQDGNQTWDFEVAAIYEGKADGSDEMQGFMHYDYFNESRSFGRDAVGWLVTKIEDPERAPEISAAIDAMFANSPTETKTSDEEGWAAGFAAQIGNISLIVRAVLGCVFFTLLLVAGNTMAQAVRERTGELAVLKTIGFGDGRILRMVLAESLTIALLGGVIGLLLGFGFVAAVRPGVAQFLPGLAVPPNALVIGIVLAVLLGLVTGLLPGIRAMRLKVVDALARI
ncbi:MAG: FtsX-like permease family protein [Pseudomonadota bacterium]